MILPNLPQQQVGVSNEASFVMGTKISKNTAKMLNRSKARSTFHPNSLVSKKSHSMIEPLSSIIQNQSKSSLPTSSSQPLSLQRNNSQPSSSKQKRNDTLTITSCIPTEDSQSLTASLTSLSSALQTEAQKEELN